ncbi:hypothetical protein [Companilactobacillus musae]|uniref:hypothetical protein n=1 Tax=Companilactobacillus musae TaxID=1903258 RepID=UPI000E64FDC5|nr:hypothetical protein [Companilactobacillus musae]
MKKLLIVMMTIILVLPFSACGNRKQTLSSDKQMTLLQKNQKRWHKQIADLPVEHPKGLENNSKYVPTSMSDFKKHNQVIIQGTVYNLQRMKSPDNKADLKVTIHVDRVIKGNKALKNTDIYTSVSGGITTTNSFYRNGNQTREANHEILVEYQEIPLPKIGSKIIAGVIPVGTVDDLDPQNNNSISVKKSDNFKLAKTYNLTNVKYGMWVKNTNDKKYHLNNPRALTKLDDNPVAKRGLEKLTKELNK